MMNPYGQGQGQGIGPSQQMMRGPQKPQVAQGMKPQPQQGGMFGGLMRGMGGAFGGMMRPPMPVGQNPMMRPPIGSLGGPLGGQQPMPQQMGQPVGQRNTGITGMMGGAMGPSPEMMQRLTRGGGY